MKSGKKTKNLKDLSSEEAQAVTDYVAEQWPLMREVLFRPERRKYIEDKVRDDGCVFCNAHKSGASKESLLLYKSKHAMIVMNKYPYNNGHLLVLPTKHSGDPLELTDDEYIEVQKTVRLAIRVLNKAYPVQGMNIGMNLGRAAGAGIPEHMHYHVIPRWIGDSNFFPVIAGSKVISETMEDAYKRIKPIVDEEIRSQKDYMQTID